MTGAPIPTSGHDAQESAWRLLRSLAAQAREDDARAKEPFSSWRRGEWLPLKVDGAAITVDPLSGAIVDASSLSPELAQLLELCLPICLDRAGEGYVYAHLGQSLDGQIATGTGTSRYVTSAEHLMHIHRLRALAQAVVVGAGTVDRDNPRLTARLVSGDNPVRVVVDPSCRLAPDRHVFRDGQAKTLLLCHAACPAPSGFPANVEVIPIESSTADLSLHAVIDALAERGLRRLFIEGGGVTVSRFLAARALNRLHMAVCPLFLGQGRPGVVLPPMQPTDLTLRPTVRRFLLGRDVLFDCAFDSLTSADTNAEPH